MTKQEKMTLIGECPTDARIRLVKPCSEAKYKSKLTNQLRKGKGLYEAMKATLREMVIGGVL